MFTKEIAFNAFLYALIILLTCPILGAIINKIVSFLLSKILRVFDRRGGLYLVFVNFITFPGVVFHELSHALIAFLLGAKIRKINLYKVSGGSLGSVSFSPRGPVVLRSMQNSLSAAAPVFMGIIAETAIYYYVIAKSPSILALIFIVYLAVSIAVHMDMSTQDVLVYMKGFVCCLLVFFLVMVIALNYTSLPTVSEMYNLLFK